MLYWFCYPPLLLTFLSNLRRNHYGLLPASTSCTANLLACLLGVGFSLVLAPHDVSAVTKTEEMAPPAQPQVIEPVTPTLSQPVRELPGALVPAQAAQPGREVNPRRTTGAERAPLEPRAGQSDPWLAAQARGIPGARWLHHAIVEFCGPRLHRRHAARPCGRCGADTTIFRWSTTPTAHWWPSTESDR